MQKEILIRHDRCMGCHSCEMACAVAHAPGKNLPAALLADKPPLKRIFAEEWEGYKAPVSCRHCEDAPCVEICVTHSLHRTEDGLVTNSDRQNKCIGCWMCVMACPFGVIRQDNNKKKAVKCDRDCLNEDGVPACVQACPTQALLFIPVEEFDRSKRLSHLRVMKEEK